MLKKPGRPSPAIVIACLALFFAVAGGSAIALNGKNTVDSGDIKPKAVRKSDIGNNAVTPRKIEANAVRTSDIRDGQVRTADIAPAEPLHILTASQLGTGGQGDCIWVTSDPSTPLPFRFNPPGYYKDSLGYVHLTGVLFAIDGPGGDGQCGGGPGQMSEDGVAFILPEGYRPTNDVVAAGGGSGGIIIGSTPLISAPEAWPAGAVASPATGSIPLLLDGTVFEPAGVSGGVPRRGSSVSARNAGGSSWQQSLSQLLD